MFETKLEKILEKVEAIDPINYGKSRNFLDGAVTRLSPYISRGVISTKYVLERVLAKNYKFYEIEKLAMELAWRDFFQKIWQISDLDKEVNQPQAEVNNFSLPKAVLHAKTGIEAVDNGINDLYEMGYVHNHQRMYIASIVTNVAKSHWKLPAQWFYYHLLDADWASNALSWQWTAAAFSNKKYYANQENINKYCGTNQRGTFLDVEYSEFPDLQIPEALQELETPVLRTNLPEKEPITVDKTLPTLIHNFYNLDPLWKSELPANRVLLLEPSHFEKYPVSNKTIGFVLKLAENIERIQIFTGEFHDLKAEYDLSEIYFKEHPTNINYSGTKESRDWMFPEISGSFSSFFKYWKKCEKILKRK